jgi:protein associated with RNAse G/E
MVARPGDTISIRALHSDGVAYRWWDERVEAISDDGIVTFSPAGRKAYNPGGSWVSRFAARTHFWFDRRYIVVEVYDSGGDLIEIYVHVASPAVLEGYQLTYIDHELDVVWKPGRAPEIVDEDEFAVAARQFGYLPEFQESCYAVANEVLGFISEWPAQRTRGSS